MHAANAILPANFPGAAPGHTSKTRSSRKSVLRLSSVQRHSSTTKRLYRRRSGTCFGPEKGNVDQVRDSPCRFLYHYLPSSVIVVSDPTNGLFVLAFQQIHDCSFRAKNRELRRPRCEECLHPLGGGTTAFTVLEQVFVKRIRSKVVRRCRRLEGRCGPELPLLPGAHAGSRGIEYALVVEPQNLSPGPLAEAFP